MLRRLSPEIRLHRLKCTILGVKEISVDEMGSIFGLLTNFAAKIPEKANEDPVRRITQEHSTTLAEIWRNTIFLQQFFHLTGSTTLSSAHEWSPVCP